MSHNIISVDSLTPDVLGKFTSQEYIQFGRGETPSSPTINLQTGAKFPFYDTAPVNTIIGATINQTSDILDSIDLPVGKYIFYLNCGACDYTAATLPWLSYHLLDSAGGGFSDTSVLVGNATDSMRTYSPWCKPSYVLITSPKNIIVKAVNSITTRVSTSSRYAETSSLTILKME